MATKAKSRKAEYPYLTTRATASVYFHPETNLVAYTSSVPNDDFEDDDFHDKPPFATACVYSWSNPLDHDPYALFEDLDCISSDLAAFGEEFLLNGECIDHGMTSHVVIIDDIEVMQDDPDGRFASHAVAAALMAAGALRTETLVVGIAWSEVYRVVFKELGMKKVKGTKLFALDTSFKKPCDAIRAAMEL